MESEQINVDLYRTVGELYIQLKGQELYIAKLKEQIKVLKSDKEEEPKK